MKFARKRRLLYIKNQMDLVVNHSRTVSTLSESLNDHREGSPVKWKRENKVLSEKIEESADGNPISPPNSLNNGKIMAIIHRFSSLR